MQKIIQDLGFDCCKDNCLTNFSPNLEQGIFYNRIIFHRIDEGEKSKNLKEKFNIFKVQQENKNSTKIKDSFYDIKAGSINICLLAFLKIYAVSYKKIISSIYTNNNEILSEETVQESYLVLVILFQNTFFH